MADSQKDPSLDYQALCELADRELRLGLADAVLLKLAREKSNGVDALAMQHYWRLRARALEWQGKEACQQARVRVEDAQRRQARKSGIHGWTWALAAFVGAVGVCVFPCLAGAAALHGHRGECYVEAVLTLGSFALTIAGIRRSRR